MSETEPLIAYLRGVTSRDDPSIPEGVVEVRLDEYPIDWFALRGEGETP